MNSKQSLFLLLACFFTVSFCFAQQETVTVTGLVKDKTGMLLPGASITEKGTSNVVATTTNGLFTIRVKNASSVLVITAVGYTTAEIPVTVNENMVIELDVRAEDLAEVAVVGYGRQKKISVVGSQITVKPDELKIPVRDLTNALAGRLAGVVAVQRSGEPGYDGSSLFIRGISTFASSPRGPLLVVDGVPDRSINNIDPEDIESFTILKDASATAVFGTRGANGVILVNTKKGKAGKAQINIEANQAFTRFTQLPQFVNAPDFMRLYNEGLTMRGRTAQYTDDVIQKHADGTDPDLYPNVNWFDELFNQYGTNNRINLNVRGGSSVANYYISAGYYNEVGMFKRDNVQAYNSAIKYNRYNFTSNVNVDLSKTTKLELGINGFLTNGNYPGIGTSALFSEATRVPPHVVPAVYSNGMAPQYQLGTPQSPYIALTRSGYATEFSNTVRSNIRLKQDLGFWLKGLSVTSMFAFDNFSGSTLRRTRNVSTFRATGRDVDSNLITSPIAVGTDVLGFTATTSTNRRIYTESALNYSNTFNSVHNVSGMLLFNQSDFVNSNATDVVSSIPFRLRGLTGRATYGYDNKYFIEGNFGYTGSENFTPNSRYGFFPSVGAGWVVSNEKFFDPIATVISHFKLRYSYGYSGNSNTGDRFLFLTQINSGNGYTFGVPGSTIGFNGLQEGQVGSDVTWETSKRHNIGIELNAFHNELQLIVELFKERRDGILLRNYTIPYASGYRADNIPYGNIGITENRGIDVSLTYTKSFKRSSFISFTGSFNYNKNRNVYDGLPPWQYPWLNRQGQTLDQRFGYVALGLFSDSAEILASPVQAGDVRPGDIRYKDLNGDGIINSYDQTAIGYGSVPRILYGLNFGFGYRGFDLSLFFQGAGMVDFSYSGGFGTTPFVEGATYGNIYSMILDRWSPETKTSNPKPFYPRLSTNQTITTNYQTSTWWIKRADYLRLKTAELGYNFSIKALKKYNVTRMRMYVNGTNLFTVSRWKIWDPELGDGRGTSYPNITAYNVGFRIGFN